MTAAGTRESYTPERVVQECLQFGGDGNLDYEVTGDGTVAILNGKEVIAKGWLVDEEIIDEIDDDEQCELVSVEEARPTVKVRKG